MAGSNRRTGGQILVDQLVAQGVEHVFCVPGESYLAVLDALHDAPIQLTVARQEAGAALMADATARLTGRPGIAFVTRGPGAMNAAHAIHIAEHDSTPLVLFIGQIERSMRERGAFQEMDYRAVFASMTKWATEIDDPARIPEIVSRAFHVAMQGRPGPVVISLPEDMLVEEADVADAIRVEPAQTWPGTPIMQDLQTRLQAARAPVAILGGSGWSQRAVDDFVRFSERFDLPVATSFRRASLFPNSHRNYAGEIGIGPNPKLKARIDNADLVLLVGGRMAEMPSQSYTLFQIPDPRQALVHVHAGAEELGRVYHPALAIHATPAAFSASLDGAPAAEDGSLGRRWCRRACRLSCLDRHGATRARRDAIWRSAHASARQTAGQFDHHEWRGQLRRVGRALSSLRTIRRAACAQFRLDGLWHSRRRRRETALSRPHRRFRLRAMAAS